VRRSRDAGAGRPAAAQAAIDALRAEAGKKSRGLFSPLKIIDAVQAAATCPSTKAWRWSASCSCNASTARSAPA
jgi:hypothetical protein